MEATSLRTVITFSPFPRSRISHGHAQGEEPTQLSAEVCVVRAQGDREALEREALGKRTPDSSSTEKALLVYQVTITVGMASRKCSFIQSHTAA